MWYTCFVCHKTYSHKWNLKRHINTVHMFRAHKCHHCFKEYKRKDYLNRHLKRVHNSSGNSNTFENIADCVTTENTPDLNSSMDNINHDSSELDDVDTFLDSIYLNSPETSISVSSKPPTFSTVSMSVSVCKLKCAASPQLFTQSTWGPTQPPYSLRIKQLKRDNNWQTLGHHHILK